MTEQIPEESTSEADDSSAWLNTFCIVFSIIMIVLLGVIMLLIPPNPGEVATTTIGAVLIGVLLNQWKWKPAARRRTGEDLTT